MQHRRWLLLDGSRSMNALTYATFINKRGISIQFLKGFLKIDSWMDIRDLCFGKTCLFFGQSDFRGS